MSRKQQMQKWNNSLTKMDKFLIFSPINVTCQDFKILSYDVLVPDLSSQQYQCPGVNMTLTAKITASSVNLVTTMTVTRT